MSRAAYPRRIRNVTAWFFNNDIRVKDKPRLKIIVGILMISR
jgi:hypothetical protein